MSKEKDETTIFPGLWNSAATGSTVNIIAMGNGQYIHKQLQRKKK